MVIEAEDKKGTEQAAGDNEPKSAEVKKPTGSEAGEEKIYSQSEVTGQLKEQYDKLNSTLSQQGVELAELRINNKQLVRCVEGLEGSRKEHESDAERYREKADESEKVSDTLRFRLEDMQKHFAEIEEQQDQALTNARNASVVPLRKSQG